MYLVTRCFNEFRAPDRQRGHAYYADGRVVLDTVRGRWILATVRGSKEYEVTIDGSEAEGKGWLNVSCQCPRFADGVACKHLWATILAVGRAHPALFPGNHSLELVLEVADSDWSEGDDWQEPVKARPKSGRKGRGKGKGGVPEKPWKHRLSTLKDALVASPQSGASPRSSSRRREAWYRLDVEASERWGRLVVELWQRKQEKGGALGKHKALRLDDSVLPLFNDPNDRELLRLFRVLERDQGPTSSGKKGGHRYFSANQKQTSAVVPGALLETVLPRLVATGRFGRWTSADSRPPRILRWEPERPWQFGMQGELGQNEELRIGGRLVRGEQSRSPREARLLLASDGVVLFGDELAPFKIPATAWLENLGREVRVPAEDVVAFLEELWSLPEVPEVVLPPKLRPEEVRQPPTPRLVLRRPRHSMAFKFLFADVSFGYADRVVAADDPRPVLFEAEGQRLLLRDLDAEHRAFEKLLKAGLTPPPGGTGERGELGVRPSDLAEVSRQLIAEGWSVEAEGRPLRGASGFEMRLTTGIDWFELKGGAIFGDVEVALPDILAALRRGASTIRLGDGSEGLLPEDWLQRYGPLANLAQGGRNDGMRFLPSQALLLDPLLAAVPEIDVDQEFAQVRDRIHSFEKVRPRNEPRGFHGTLRPYQREGLGWLHFLEQLGFGGCLADDMGLGKTVQVLALLQMRRAAGRGWEKPSLIVAPKSVVSNWIEEAARFAPRLQTADYTGSERHDIRERLTEHDVVVTTYGTLLRDAVYLKDFDLGYVILDEAQAIKNPSSQTAKACRLLKADHRLALTGTPVENHLGDLWSIFDFLNPGMLGRIPGMSARSGHRTPSQETLEQVAKALGPFILRRTKEEVLSDLPPKTEQTLYCDLGARQRRIYDGMREHYRKVLTQKIGEQGLGRSKIQVLEALLRLRQVACHPGLISEKHERRSSAKLDVLFEQIEEIIDEGHKALVFSQFTRLLDLVRRDLDARNITYEYLDGRTRQRASKIQRFQEDPDCPLFLISLKAGGVGLNLTAADYVFLLDPWWNPAVEAQAIDRAHRIGQVRPVNAYRLIARNTVEEKIVKLQASKRDLADAILTADQGVISELTSEDLEMLLS